MATKTNLPSLDKVNTIDEEEERKAALSKATATQKKNLPSLDKVTTIDEAEAAKKQQLNKVDATKLTRAEKNKLMETGTVIAMTKNGVITTDSPKDVAQNYIQNVKAAQQQAANKASAVAVSKSYNPPAQQARTSIGNNIASRTTSPQIEHDTSLTPAQKAKNAVGQNIANIYNKYNEGEKWLTKDNYVPSNITLDNRDEIKLQQQQKARNNAVDFFSNIVKNAANDKEIKNTVNLENREDARNRVREEVWKTNEGDAYATNLFKGLGNRYRSTVGNAIENLAGAFYDVTDKPMIQGYKPGDEITLENRDAARAYTMGQNSAWYAEPLREKAKEISEERNAGKVYDMATEQITEAQKGTNTKFASDIISAADSSAQMLAYMSLPYGTKYLSYYMSLASGAETYNERRAMGDTKEEALNRAVATGTISAVVESLGGIGKFDTNVIEEIAAKNFITKLASQFMSEGGEELLEYGLDYVANVIADKMFKGEIQTTFDPAEMFHNAFVGGLAGLGFGAANYVGQGITGNAQTDASISEVMQDIVAAVKNTMPHKANSEVNVQTQQKAPAEEALEQAANIPTETKTEQETPFASPTEKTFEQRAEELYKQGKSWGEIGKTLQAEYHPDWNVDNVKKEARNYIRKSDFYGEKGTANIDNSENTVYAENSQFATIAPYYDTNVTAENKAEVKNNVDNDFRTRAKDVASALGMNIKNVYSNMGGFEFSEGENAGKQVNEISYTFEFDNSTPEQAQLFASLMGENGYEQQEAVISKSYVDNIDDGNAYEYDVRYNGLDAFAVADMLKRNGISDYTIDETTNTVQVLDFDLSGDIELETKIKNLINEMGGNYYGTDYRPVQSSYLDAREREKTYSKWLDESGVHGSSSLRDNISQSLQKVQEFIRKNAGTEVTNEAGAESPGFSDGQNSLDYSALQNITNTLYGKPDAENKDIYAPFYPKDNRPEGNTVGAKQSIEGTYANAQNKYDVFPEGENAARVVDVPQKMNDETNVTRFVRTEMEAKVTPDSLIPVFEKAVEQGDFSYNKVTDKSAVDYAVNEISKNGVKESIGEFIAKVDEDKILTKNDLVIGEMLYAQAANAGDVKTAMKLASALGHEFTKAGQAAQAARILKKLSPEGRLYNAQKISDRLFKNGISKSEIKIDEELAQNLLNAKTDAEIEAAEDAIKNNIAEQIEKTPVQKFIDKWNAWRYLSMLGNPKTHIRNFLGNLAFYPVRKIKNAVKSVLEAGMEEKTATLKRATKEQKDFAKESYDKNAKILMSGGSYRFESDIESREQIFKSKILEAIRKANGGALEAEDAIFLKNAYIDSLSQYLRANDIDPANITPEQRTKAENYAQKEAWKATYRDASKVASALEHLSKSSKKVKFIMDAFLPFRKTPINVLARGIEYSPVGLVKGIVDLTARVKKVGASTAIDEIASGLTGTGIAALGYWLASMGLISGGDDENDKVQNFEELQGKQNYALDIGKIADNFGFNIGDVNYTIDWAAPTSLPLFVGVELYNALKTEEFDTDDAGRLFSATLDTISRTADPMIGLSMLQNLETVISGNYDGNAFSGLIGEAIIGYILQAFPTLGSQIAQTIDGTRRNAYFKDPNSKMLEVFQIPLNRIMQKIPGLSQNLPERVDEWGRTEKQSDNIAMRVFENFFSPGYIGRGNTTEVDKFLSQLYVKTGDNSILPSTMAKNFTVDGEKTNLSAKQYAEAQKVKGQTAYNLVEDVRQNPIFKGLSAEEQASVIASIYQYSTAIAKSKVSDYELTDWIAKASEAEKQGLEIDDYITLHKIKSNLEKTDEKSVSEQFLDQLYVTKISDEAKVTALEYIGGVNVDKYRSAVSDPKDMLALYDITSFDDAKEGQVEKDVDIEQIQKQFGVDWDKAHEIYNKAEDNWSYTIEDVIDASTNPTSREATVKNLTRWGFTDSEIIGGYNSIIGYGNAKKDVQLELLTNYFGDAKKAEKFYGVKEGLKDYR